MSIDTTKDLEEIKKEYANRSDKPGVMKRFSSAPRITSQKRYT